MLFVAELLFIVKLYFISFLVIDALKAGAQVFKTLSQEYGLTIDNVEKIMGDVEDVRLYH